jgi:hypothetical protein
LINDRRGCQLHWIKIANGEAIEPCLAVATETPKTRSASVPLGDVDPVRATLAEEEKRHESGV